MNQDASWYGGRPPVDTEVGIGRGHSVLDGDSADSERGTAAPSFSAHVCCGQRVAHLSNC